MPSRWVAALALGLAVAVVQPAAGSRPAAPVDRDLTLGPLISGETAVHDGTWTWTDYAYDDTGADTGGSTGGGDAAYPADVTHNAADLIQLQLRRQQGQLRVTAVLETLVKVDEPMLGVAFNSDGDSSTGAASLPGGAWKPDAPLGLDALVLVSSRGGALWRPGTSGWQPVGPLPAEVSVATNSLTTAVDLDALGATGSSMKVVGAVGLARAGATWLDGSGPIFDLAFVRGEDPAPGGSALGSATQVAVTGKGHATGAPWQDSRQADVLAASAPATTAVATVALADLRSGVTRLPDRYRPGYHTWLYHSSLELGEGIVDGTAGGGLWAGPYQPYVVQVPTTLPASPGALVYLHGGGQNHLNNGVLRPQGDLDQGAALAVLPFGREFTTAQEHGYSGASEQDVLDVISSVVRDYAVDTRRIVVAGVSTGGGGAYRMAQLYPDKFAGALVLSAYDDTKLPENLLNIPVRFSNGGADPAASQPMLAATVQPLDSLGYVDYRSRTATTRQHADPVGVLNNCVIQELLGRPTVVDPARVVYAVDPANEVDEGGVTVLHRGAYWVSGLSLRDGASPRIPVLDPAQRNLVPHSAAVGTVDVTSLARPVRTTVGTAVDGVGDNLDEGADYCGPNPAATSGDTWREHGMAQRPGPAQAVSNGATLRSAGVGAVRLDTARMALDVARPVTVQADTDGPLRLTLKGDWRARSYDVSLDGQVLTRVMPDKGELTIVLSAPVVGQLLVRPTP